MVDLVVYISVQNQSVLSVFEEMYLLKTFFIGDNFIIFVACLVCLNSIFTTYAIFPYIRRTVLHCASFGEKSFVLNVYDFVEQLYFF